MSTEPITQVRAGHAEARARGARQLGALLQLLELAGGYHRAATARRIGVPQVEMAALEHIDAFGGLTPGELGHRLGLTSGGVTALTGRLIDAGYVARKRHPDDGRMRVLTVTPAGAACLSDQLDPVLESAAEALAALSFAEAELLGRVLEDVAARREEAAAATPGPERTYATDGYTRALLM
jgi:DNA-binding MarR family transcriptional regulator